jgi:hypothetical protein
LKTSCPVIFSLGLSLSLLTRCDPNLPAVKMKFVVSLLALAVSSVLATGDHPPPPKHETVYTTTTVCPVTSTITEKGT